jgi:hypothetical protein
VAWQGMAWPPTEPEWGKPRKDYQSISNPSAEGFAYPADYTSLCNRRRFSTTTLSLPKGISLIIAQAEVRPLRMRCQPDDDFEQS